MGFTDGFEAGNHCGNRLIPADGNHGTGFVLQEWRGRTFGRCEGIQSLPSLGTCHAEIHRIIGLRCQVDGVSFFIEMDLQLTTGGAVAADRCGSVRWFEPCRDLPEAELAWRLHQVTCQGTSGLFEKVPEHEFKSG